MIRFAADEDFNNDVVRALRRSLPDVNIVGVREAGSFGEHPEARGGGGGAGAGVFRRFDDERWREER